jgi:hypothetical protein
LISVQALEYFKYFLSVLLVKANSIIETLYYLKHKKYLAQQFNHVFKHKRMATNKKASKGKAPVKALAKKAAKPSGFARAKKFITNIISEVKKDRDARKKAASSGQHVAKKAAPVKSNASAPIKGKTVAPKKAAKPVAAKKAKLVKAPVKTATSKSIATKGSKAVAPKYQKPSATAKKRSAATVATTKKKVVAKKPLVKRKPAVKKVVTKKPLVKKVATKKVTELM